MKQLEAYGVWHLHEPMQQHTTLKVGGPARYYFRPHDKQALLAALPYLPTDLPWLGLGRGSNMLIAEQGIDALVVDLAGLKNNQYQQGLFTFEAGMRMHQCANMAASAGITGFECMATIPGHMGGGVAMNAGAFGQELSQTLSKVLLLSAQGELYWLEAEALNMRYRHTELPANHLVLAACLQGQADCSEAIRQRMQQMRQQRRQSQPLQYANCGSVFKNPPHDHAARLIEAAGLKGYSIGGASISTQHANFIINKDQEASANDVLQLIRYIQETVQQQFQLQLETEVRCIGTRS